MKVTRSRHAMLLILFGLFALLQAIKVPPRIETHSKDQTVVSGGPAVLECTAVGNPNPQIEWRKNGERITNELYTAWDMPNGSVLRIEPAMSKRDDAMYECVAENGVGEPARASATLEVLPEISLPKGFPAFITQPHMQRIEEGRNATIPCEVEGDSEQPNVKWFKDMIPLDMTITRYSLVHGSSLQITDFQTEDLGNYECMAENSRGSAFSDMATLYMQVRRVPPYFSTRPKNRYEVMPGSALNITCVVRGLPESFVKWRKGLTDITPDHSIPIGKNVLLLTDISESANYTCIAESKLGMIYTNVQVVVQDSVLYVAGVPEAGANLTNYFLNLRQPSRFIDKWSPHLLRTAVALFFSDSKFFTVGNRTGEEIAYELSLQLLLKLALQKRVSTQELSLFVNALTVACINPKNFFGVNAVAELRKRANNSNVTNAFALLTLCNAGADMTAEDVVKLQQQFGAHYRPPWTDTQALITMAIACISSRSDVAVDGNIVKEMVTELKKRQFRNGTDDNVRTTALVMQALLATNTYKTDINTTSAVKAILKAVQTKYVPINDLYYILPVLNSMSMVNISSKHCRNLRNTDLEVVRKLVEKHDERIEVKFSVYIWEETDFIRTWKLKVPANYTFYQFLENFATLEPTYKVQYSESDGKPYVTGLANFYDNAEEGLFWFIYTQSLSETDSTLRHREESPVDIPVNANEEFILWYRPRIWAE